MTHSGNDRTDADIQAAVLRELRGEVRVDETKVSVQVEKDVVTLTGAAGDYAEKLVAEEATHRVAGVLDVANEIQVRGPDRPAWSGTETAQSASSLDAPEQSDPYQDQGAPEQIRRSVEEALGQRAERQPHLIRRESEEILVEVRDGQALLSGELGTWDEKEAALGAAGQAPGVSGVEDHLVIRHSL